MILFFLLAAMAWGQDGYYRFAVNQDGVGGAVDFSFLNHPLTAEDKITVAGGKFVNGRGEAVRFYGVNLAFSANFPAPEDAARIAKRLRRLGVNLVRLHHMDTQPDGTPANANSLLTTGPYPTLNEVAVGRLRGFLNAMKAEGIYVNLNLKVGYVFRPAVDGVAAGTIPTQSKPLHMIEPRMIALQQEYARKVIGALELKNDPVLAMVEINNESSLAYSWQTNQLDTLVLGSYRETLGRAWNGFLEKRYGTTAALREAWGATEEDSGQILPERWQLEVHAGSQATLRVVDGSTAQVEFVRNDARVIAKQVGFDVVQGDGYMATLEMRANGPVNVYWDVKQDVSPWRTMTSRNVTLGPEWQTFTMPVTGTFGMQGIGRFGVQIEGSTQTVQLRNARMVRKGKRGLNAEETLEARNVAVPSSEPAAGARMRDFLDFLAAADGAYLEAMMGAVREAVEWRVPVAGTQMDFGGLLNLDSHRRLDYQDYHFYVDHYNFPNVAWDGRDWRIRDASHVAGNLSNVMNAAAAREAGRPFTLSEFNQNWPNRQGHELLLPLAAYGAFQDWDGLMHFAYSHGRGWDAGVPNGFNLNGDWSKWVSFGQTAWLFRTGAVQTPAETVRIPVTAEERRLYTEQRRNRGFAAWASEVKGVVDWNLLRHKVGLDVERSGGAPEALRQRASGPVESSTGEVVFHAEAKLFLVNAPKAAGVVGRFGQALEVGPMVVEPAETGFRTVLLTVLDGESIAGARRMLLTNPGHTLRSQPGTQRPQRMVNYPGTTDWFTVERDQATRPSGDLNGGSGPTWMEQTKTRIVLKVEAEQLEVLPLNEAGEAQEGIAVKKTAEGYEFVIGETTPWYEIRVGKS